MDRLIGIDYGRRRTGLAASDPLRIFASALDTVDTAKLIDYLKNYTEKETIERFVVGYPVNMDGSPSEAQADVDAFLKVLQKAFPGIPVSLEDERFTSVRPRPPGDDRRRHEGEGPARQEIRGPDQRGHHPARIHGSDVRLKICSKS